MGLVLKFPDLWVEFASQIDDSSNTQPGRCAQICETQAEPTVSNDVTVTGSLDDGWNISAVNATALMCTPGGVSCVTGSATMSFDMIFEAK
jgi:hypothetical protein